MREQNKILNWAFTSPNMRWLLDRFVQEPDQKVRYRPCGPRPIRPRSAVSSTGRPDGWRPPARPCWSVPPIRQWILLPRKSSGMSPRN